jgi:hypothetical protein
VPVGTGATSPASLPPFAHDWVGGDIHGLSAFSGTLYRYVPEIGDVVTALDKKVSQIAGDAGWQGSAASAFTRNWEQDAAGANALGVVINSAGGIVDQLALDLAKIENALEEAAAKAAANGVPVGSGGQPPQACFANATQNDWAQAYQSFWQQCMQTAQSARVQAAGALQALYAQIAPPAPGEHGVTLADATTISDYLRGFWALPTVYRKYVEDKVSDLKTEAKEAKTAYIAAREAARDAQGRFGNIPQDVKAKLAEANDQLASARDDVTAAATHENAVTKVLDTRLSDLPGLSSTAAGLDNADFFSKMTKFGLDFPVIDVAAAGIGTVLAAQDDVSKGIPWYEAYPGEAASNVGGIALGALAGTAVAGAVGGLAIAGAPVMGVVAGVAAGGIVAIGVADFGHNLIVENWGGDIHQHGVVLGVADGIGDSAENTGKDMWGMAKDVGHTAASVWHGVTSFL